MCGIAGAWRPGGWSDSQALEVVTSMTDAIRHRGPDAGAVWVDAHAGIGLGHRRLSILDLSPAGAQPMTSRSGRFVLVFNGEIYNHLELRRQLEAEGAAPPWRGHSDTETLLASVEHWGANATLTQLAGMFAFALWDRRDRRLTLARDRLGEKPLYYGFCGRTLVFASELKALRVCPGFDDTLDQAALAGFMRNGYVPESASIYAAVRKVPPGCTVSYATPEDWPAPRAYWRLQEVIRAGSERRLQGDYRDLCDKVECAMVEVVRSQMLSDVPLGCFLSGGIDSSLVAALMQDVTDRQVRTFSIGFESKRFDEAAHARRVAEHIGTQHTEFIVTEAEALEVIPDLPRIYDEPFADSSQIPMVLLSRLARQEVTVALTGDGGDEVFGGYNRHVLLPAVWRVLRHLPLGARRALGRALGSLGRGGASEAAALHQIAAKLGLPLTTFDKMGRISAAIGTASDYAAFYRAIACVFPEGAEPLRTMLIDWGVGSDLPEKAHSADWTMATDTLTYLPGDVLTKVDRAAMSASLETRTPYLDRRIVELAWALPRSARIRGRTGKRILRDVLHRHVPKDHVDRPKQGFSIPLDRWLRGELRDWADALMNSDRLVSSRLLEADPIRRLWLAHLAGTENAGPRLWTILMLQAWLADQSVAAQPEAPRAALRA
jgi:asparagine synthase (glutamine-hydrolysing)